MPKAKLSPIPFLKMEGCGNDYIFIDTDHLPTNVSFSAQEIKRISDRHTGIGSDGLVLMTFSDEQDQTFMRMWNADGSPSKMCGNALRCLALWQYRRCRQKEFSIRSESAVHKTRIFFEPSDSQGQLLEAPELTEQAQVEINMGSPIFASDDIPFSAHKAVRKRYGGMICAHLDVKNFGKQEVYVLSMGNPHCVLFVNDQDTAPVQELGPILEAHPAFPKKTNVIFACQRPEGLFMRTFERGSGETLACGSGACAAHVAAVLTNRGKPCQKVRLRGGSLEIVWDPETTENANNASEVLMRGPARLVYEGQFFYSNFSFDQ